MRADDDRHGCAGGARRLVGRRRGRPADRADRDPFVWSSGNGRAWTRLALPATGADEIVQRLVRVGAVVHALGCGERIPGVGVRARVGSPSTATDAGEWRAVAGFGATGTGAVAGWRRSPAVLVCCWR
ncbi:hypothetical protein NKG94_48220 [Micromonospora sp. M12]